MDRNNLGMDVILIGFKINNRKLKNLYRNLKIFGTAELNLLTKKSKNSPQME